MKYLTLLLTGILLFACGSGDKNNGKKTIAVIPKGTTQVFWQSVHAGAVKAGVEENVNVVWIGPEKEDDRQQQIALLDNQIMNEVNGIVLAPLDEMALRRPVRAAVKKGIPVVIMDSGLKDSEDVYSSFVATDNFAGGRLAAQQMGKMLNGKGKVVVLRFVEGSSSTEKRANGFIEGIKEFPGIEVVSDEQYAGATKSTGQQTSENLLLRFRDENGNLTFDGVFCTNESSTYGMMMALRRLQLAKTVKFIGFDASDPLIEGLKNGEIQGIIIQNPFKIGYLGVKTMCDVLNGKKVAKRIDTGVSFLTLDNLNDPKIQEIIHPDLDKWLK